MERLEMDVMMIRANACMSTGRYAEARRLLETILHEEPAHGVAHGMLGWIHWALLEDHERALVHLRCAVRWSPRYVNAWFHYLHVLVAGGMEDELHAAFMQALGVPGIDRAEVHAIVARYLERTGRAAEAIMVYRNALRCCTATTAETDLRAAIRRIRRRTLRRRMSALLGL